MPPVHPFRTSLYLSLAVAILALGVASGDLLPEIPFVTAFGLLLLGAAYALEGRWQLSLRDANLVGLCLGALLGLWGLFQAVRPPTGLPDTLPWPASALPYLAPVLMILIPAKLFRPKHVGDYWAMHGLGLMAMALACAMASDGMFILLFALYAAVFVWSLEAFHLYRELGPALAAGTRLAGGRWRDARPAVRWAALTGAVAVPLFWATPRSSGKWELGINDRGRASTGLTDGPVDLNTTGSVAVNRERAFEFYAEDKEGRPVADLPPDLRFRGIHLQLYENGRWGRNQFGALQMVDRPRSPALGPAPVGARQVLPDLGPGTVYLAFTLEPRLIRTPPLADPVAWRPDQNPPAASRFEHGAYRSWVVRHDGTLDGAFSFDTGNPQYTQAWVLPADPARGPVMRVQSPQTGGLTKLPPGGLPQIKRFTDELLKRLVAAGALPPAALDRDANDARYRLPAHHEAIARALERHLAASGEYVYTLDLTREDKAIDPCEDFLLNTKAGHCQRFATALVLMLRTQGIAAQMVLGYRGCESRGDGWYDVREDQAHAWVEVLVPAPADGVAPMAPRLGAPPAGPAPAAARNGVPPNQFGWEPMRWIILDPTPAGDLGDAAATTSLLGQARQRWASITKALLLAYNKESREQAAQAVEEWVTELYGGFYLIGGAAVLAGLWWVRRSRARRRAAAGARLPAYVRRLTAALKAAGYAWPDGRTAREYVSEVAGALRLAPATAAVADVLGRVVTAYYAERFGDRPLAADERRGLDGDLSRLEAALA
jgi:hypothetical protein